MASNDEKQQSEQGRLLLISNRLPITIKRASEGKYNFSMSSGGLVSGLSGLAKSKKFQWYGWPGLQIPEKEIQLVRDRLADEYSAFPIFVDDELADKHYNGFSSTYDTLLRPQLRSNLARRNPLGPPPLPPW